ncbi:ketopantoate reductase C-terminal domain-containing protein [Salinicoccus sp. Marseille-QA3877]
MKIACIGIGAVGSIIARELKSMDLDITLFSRTERNGFTILENNEYIDYDYFIQSIDNHDETKFDIIFISTKATALRSLVSTISEISHDDTDIILCENGMGYDSWFKNSIPAVVYISGQKKHDYIEHFRDSRLIIENKKYRHLDELIEQLESDQDVELEIIKNDKFEKLRYEKLLINLGVNTMTALSQNTAQIFKDADVVDLTKQLLKEGQKIINQESDIITDDFIDESVKLFQSYPDHMGTSMYYDVMDQKETEYEFIQKYFHDNKGDLSTPVLDVIYTLLKGYSYGFTRGNN